MRKICFVTSSLVGPTLNGGVGTAMYYQALLLANEGNDVTIMFNGGVQVKDIEYWKKKYLILNIKLLYLNDEILDYRMPINNHNWWIFRSYYIMRWLETQSFDIVHFAETCGYAYHTIQAKRTLDKFCNTKIVITMHSPTEWIYEGDKRWLLEINENDRKSNLFLKLNFAERYVCENADLLLAPSNNMFEWAIKHGWKLADNRKVLFNPFQGAQKMSIENIDYNHFIFFGTLNKRKGIDFFCDAIIKFYNFKKEKNEEKLKISFLGRCETVNNIPSNDYIIAKLQNLDLEIEIHNDFDTFMANEYILNSKGIAVLCSNQDNSPYSIVECIENGIPFICSNVGGIPELVDEKILFKSNAVSLYKKLIEIKSIDWKNLVHKYESQEANKKIIDTNIELMREINTNTIKYNNTKSKVSICIAYRNHGRFILDLIDSINKNQYENKEIIIVDDGSDEIGSINVLDDIRRFEHNIKIKRIERSSKGMAYNVCASMADGEYLLFVDAESILNHNAIEKLLFGMEKSCSDLIGCHTQELSGIGRPSLMNIENNLIIPIGGAKEVGILENCFVSALFMMKKNTFFEFGQMEERDILKSDISFIIKMMIKGKKLEVVPETLAWNRVFNRENDMFYNFNSQYDEDLLRLTAYFSEENNWMIHFMKNWCMARFEKNILDENKDSVTISNKDEQITVNEIKKNIFEDQNKELNKKIIDLTTELRRITKEKNDLEITKNNENKLIEQLYLAINNYETSTCWKITAPLRKIFNFIRGI